MSDRWIRFIGTVLSIWILYFIRTRYGYKPALLAFALQLYWNVCNLVNLQAAWPMSADYTATLMCRNCLREWTTPAERVSYPVDSEQVGTIDNFEINTCPHCGDSRFWDVTSEGR